MRYLIISNYGTRLGVSGALLTVHENTNLIREIPLSRLRTVCITKNGVSLSSSLIKECAARGIRIFFLDWRGVSIACVSGDYQRATVTIRKNLLILMQKLEMLLRKLLSQKFGISGQPFCILIRLLIQR